MLDAVVPHDLLAPVLACIEGRLSPNMALMQLASAAADQESIDSTLRQAARHPGVSATGAERLAALRALRSLGPGGLQAVRDIAALAARAHGRGGDWAQTFDEAARLSPEASVALYSLGDPELLNRQTRELVTMMMEWGLLQPDSHVLDFGCGIGRVSAAIAPYVNQVTGIDVSGEMVRLARERTSGHRNISIGQVAANPLAAFADRSFDLILAIDSFPYVVDSALAEPCIAEMQRVLVPDRHLLIMNYSYRGDLALDQTELRRLAESYGFDIQRDGTSDLTLWDGRAFLLRRR